MNHFRMNYPQVEHIAYSESPQTTHHSHLYVPSVTYKILSKAYQLQVKLPSDNTFTFGMKLVGWFDRWTGKCIFGEIMARITKYFAQTNKQTNVGTNHVCIVENMLNPLSIPSRSNQQHHHQLWCLPNCLVLPFAEKHNLFIWLRQNGSSSNRNVFSSKFTFGI